MSASHRHDFVRGFYMQAEDDAASSSCLFDNEHYGNSAYLCQQSIEKTIKATMMDHELTGGNVEELGHMPLVKLWTVMGLEAKQFMENAKNEKAKKSYESLYNLINAGKLIFLNSTRRTESAQSTKTAWWKISLGIPLNTDEMDRIKKFVPNFTKTLVRVIALADHTAELANSKHAKRRGIRHEVNTTKKAIKGLVKRLDELKQIKNITSIMQLDLGPEFAELGKALFKIAHQQQLTNDFVYRSTVMLLWAAEFAIPILMITPHEDIGRYPMMISRQKSTIAYYEEKRVKLQDLEETVMRARSKLPVRMRPNTRMHSTRLLTNRKRK